MSECIPLQQGRRAAIAFVAAAGLAGLVGCGGGDGGSAAARPLEVAMRHALAAAMSEAPAVDPEALLDWAETTYPAEFPKGTLSWHVQHGGLDFTVRAYAGPWGWRYLGVTPDGEVYGLGDFTQDRLQRLGQASDWSARLQADRCSVYPLAPACGWQQERRTLAAGMDGTAALRSDGRVLAWGMGTVVRWSNVDVPYGTTTPGTQVRDTGLDARWIGHGLAPRAVGLDGTVLIWDAYLGGLWATGDEFPEGAAFPAVMYRVTTPTRLHLPDRIVQIEEDFQGTSAALREDGSVWIGPGQNARSPNGVGHRYVPVRVTGLPVVRALGRSSAARAEVGLVAIGLDDSAWRIQGAADGSYQATHPAQRIPGLPAAKSAACAERNCMVLAQDGSVWVWGSNAHGALGNGQLEDVVVDVPTRVAGLTDIVDVALTATAAFAVDRQGQLWSWGEGPLGYASAAPVLQPRAVFGAERQAVEVSAGRGFVVVRQRDGTVVSWGVNDMGQLGIGPPSRDVQVTPARVIGIRLF
ncbi:hypothetical protein [Ideonella sp. A 288]|uniref:RCC1 domain-containing protein n=1 Tax=Ideonella sp. A 288 TaxID=1962181 RepID=UPI001303B751|nr:hypothetical protein [Ideonella sp. A 288]